MKFYFAGGESMHVRDRHLIQRVLLSFAGINQKSLKEKNWTDIFLDSGAFSVFTGKSDVTIDQYGRFLLEHKDRFTVYSNFDVIGDAEGTAKNQKYLEKMGLNPIPVFHHGSHFSHLEKLCEEYEYISLGGLVPLKIQPKRLKNHLNKCFSIVKKHKTKVHGFGVTRNKVCEIFPFYSVDSTTWKIGSRFGWPLTDTLKQCTLSNTNNNYKLMQTKMHQEKIDTHNIKMILQYEDFITRLWKKRGVEWET